LISLINGGLSIIAISNKLIKFKTGNIGKNTKNINNIVNRTLLKILFV
jgi:hypothetical protein